MKTLALRSALTLLPLCAVAPSLMGQSLFHAPVPPTPTQQPAQQQPVPPGPPAASSDDSKPPASTNTVDPAAKAQTQPAQANSSDNAAVAAPIARPALPNAQTVSLFSVQAIKPRKFFKHDKIEIIVNQTSLQKFEQNTNSKEQADINASLKALPSIEALLTDFVLKNTGTTTPRLGVGNNSNYKGSGSYERKDRFTARISAIVTDVKPNGMLVLEARELMLSDKESKQMVVSGLCDPRDITNDNTVISSQLANLVIKTEHAGDVKDAATKGWLPRVFDVISGNN